MPYNKWHVDIKEFDDVDLIDELESRGYTVDDETEGTFVDQLEEIETIVQLHRCKDPAWEQRAVDLLYTLAGKIV